MSYQSPFGEESLFNGSKERSNLSELLLKRGITEFVYSNVAENNGTPLVVRIHGKIVDSKLQIKQFTFSLNSNLSTNESSVFYISDLLHLKDKFYFLAYKINDGWIVCDKFIDNGFVTSIPSSDLIEFGKLNELEYKQIHNEFFQCSANMSIANLKSKFDSFCKKINKQLANKFYGDVDLATYVKLIDNAGNIIFENTLKTDYRKKNNDIKLNITLTAEGKIKIEHDFSDTYLQKYEQRWIDEAKRRGLDVDISEIRTDIINYLESEEAELSFGKKFLQNVKTWYDSNVGDYIQGIQATQKITQNIWKEGTINQSTWYSKDDEHNRWPQYVQFNPVVGGATDGVVDEIVGIPMACKSIYQLVTDDEKRKALANTFTKEGFKQMLNGLKNEYEELSKDEEKRGHFGGKSAVSVISMMMGAGFFSKAGKLDEFTEVSETVSKHIDDVPDIKIGHLDDIRNDENILHVPENRKDINKFFESQDIKKIEEFSEEVAEDIDYKKSITKDPKKFILGKKLEQALSSKITKEMAGGGEEILQKIAQEVGLSVADLRGMKHVTQLQLKLPDGGFTVIDDVFVKEVNDVITNTKTFELILSETKLSNLSPFTGRQDDFIKALNENNITEFVTRSRKEEISKIIQQGSTVKIKKYLKAEGDGTESITNIDFKTIAL